MVGTRRAATDTRADVQCDREKFFLDGRHSSEWYSVPVTDTWALAAHAYWHKHTRRYWFGYDESASQEEVLPTQGGLTGELLDVRRLDGTAWPAAKVKIR